MNLRTASGKEYNLDFEPIRSLMDNPISYTRFIINEINSGIYDNSICPGVVLDAGANIGLFSIYASTIAHKVYALEPCPDNYENLIKIIAQLGITNIIPINSALWTETGTVILNTFGNENTTAHSITSSKESSIPILVTSIDFPTFFKIYGIKTIDYFKCDIEGSEFNVIGSSKFDQVAKGIANIFLEVHYLFSETGVNPDLWERDKIVNKLKQFFPVVACDGDIITAGQKRRPR